MPAAGSARRRWAGTRPTGTTYSQRSKEEAHDYRYFPEPDLPPLVVETDWIERVAAGLPELPRQKKQRLMNQFGLSEYDARLLVRGSETVADFFEQTVAGSAGSCPPN